MKFKIFCLLLTLFSTVASAKNLCSQSEKVVFSFETKSKKILSICKAESGNYLTYKFGTSKNIELQFPNLLDVTSWKKFDFSGRRRGGGKRNAGFGDYSLSFGNGDAEFTVFQQWSDEDDTYSIGVTITGAGKPITINGLKKTQEGSLLLLDEERKNIANTAD